MWVSRQEIWGEISEIGSAECNKGINLSGSSSKAKPEQPSKTENMESSETCSDKKGAGEKQKRAQGQRGIANLNVSPARLAGDNALDVFQKHREKELKERQQMYW
jgi:hypothetical protein